MNLGSLLKALLHHSAPEAVDAEQTEEAPDMLPSPRMDQGMPVEVMKDFDTVLLFGRLASGSPEELTIQRIPGEMGFPLSEAGSAVLVRGYDTRRNPMLMRARVVCASGSAWTVGGLKLIPYETRRESVRHPLTPPAAVHVLENGAPGRPQQCRLVNISASGACIVSEHSYTPEQPLCLQVGQAGKGGQAACRCQVVRITPRRGGQFEYGLSFTQLNGREHGALERVIQAIRQETEKKLLPQGMGENGA